MQNLGKPILFGSIFGFIFGFLQFIVLGIKLTELDIPIGSASFVIYLILLYLLLNQESLKNFGQRFLAGLLFSLAIGLVYGFTAGMANAVFAQNVLEIENEGLSVLQDFGLNTRQMIEENQKPTPVLNFISEFFGAIFFNLFAGAFWGAIFALIIGSTKKDNSQPQINNPQPSQPSTPNSIPNSNV